MAAKTVRWIQTPPEEAASRGPGSAVLVIVVSAVIALLTTLYVYRLTRRTAPVAPATAPQLDALKDLGVEGDGGKPPAGSTE